jgi:hypothetical protein
MFQRSATEARRCDGVGFLRMGKTTRLGTQKSESDAQADEPSGRRRNAQHHKAARITQGGAGATRRWRYLYLAREERLSEHRGVR